MDEQVTQPIEKALADVTGKQDVVATTGNNYSQMTITLHSGTNIKDAKQQIQDSISTINLPKNVMKPYVVNLNTSQIPVVEIGLTFTNGIGNKELNTVDNEIVPMFKQIKGVGNVMTAGETNQQVSIKVDPVKLAAAKVPLQNLYTLLQGRNSSVAVGEQTLNNKATDIIVTGKIQNINEIKNMKLNDHTHLKDVAEVTLEKDTQSIVHMNGKDFIEIVVQKDATSNAVSVGKGVTDAVKQINDKYKGTLQANAFINLADTVQSSINSMTREVLTGALFATLIIWLFLRSFRMTLITIVSIPLSLCITLILLSFFGVTLNILTLGGIAVSVGRLVDDSIVVVENIYRRKQGQELKKDVLIDSVKEVAAAITSSTLTTVAVFLPAGLASGSLKSIVLPFAITITCSLLSSLLVSLTVVPMLSTRMMKKVKMKEHKPKHFYPSFLQWTLNHKWLPIVLSIAVIVASIGLFSSMPKGSVDQSDSSYITVTLHYKDGTRFQDIKDGLTKMESILSNEKGVKSNFAIVGTNGEDAQWGQLTNNNDVAFSAFLDNGANSATIVNDIRKTKDQFPNAELSANTAGLMGPSETNVSVDVTGKDDHAIKNAADIVSKQLKSIDGIQKVSSSNNNVKPTVRITVDPTIANADEIAQSVGAIIQPATIGSVDINGRTTTVQLGALKEISKPEDLENLQIMTANGMVNLSKLAKVEYVNQPSTLYSKDGHHYLVVSATVDPKKEVDVTSAVQGKIAKWKKDNTLGSDSTAEISNSSLQSADDLNTLGKIALLSIGLVFMILLITLKSFRASLAILISLPMAAIGSLLGLVISKSSIDISSGIGMLMLVGIVVTNAIVLVDRIRHNEERMAIREAIIEAGSVRLRPILMTALATVFAMIPLIFTHDSGMSMNLVSKGLAVVVISGLTVSTLLTLIVIPTFYELFHFRKAKKQRQNVSTSINYSN
jgi:HAE1 family hydrophobic/amphiphilic exporter-1